MYIVSPITSINHVLSSCREMMMGDVLIDPGCLIDETEVTIVGNLDRAGGIRVARFHV